MRTTRSLSVTLPVDMADMVKAKVASGQYATESEVIRDGLRTLAARDSAIERWLKEDVAAAYDAHKSEPQRATLLRDSMAKLHRQFDGIDSSKE
jgi:antitoxin ParD1/3/4